MAPIDEQSKAMARHLIKFLEKHYGEVLPPLQSGVGNVANAVMAGLVESDYKNLKVWTEVIQDAMFDLIDAGKLNAVSGTSLSPSPEGLQRFYKNILKYRDKIILRPQEISNNAEIARRMGLIAMNTALEVDIYANVNSTHTLRTRGLRTCAASTRRRRCPSSSRTAQPPSIGPCSGILQPCQEEGGRSHPHATRRSVQLACALQ
jgi:succinyl-CoA:acetate CoA-transferase